MSKTDELDRGAGVAVEPGPALVPAFACEAHELKAILQHIADHISDADRRHCDTLGAMQERLAELGQEAAGVRSRLPQEMSPALDRIEDGMAMLAERLAAADESRSDALDSQDDTAVGTVDIVGCADAGQQEEPWDQASADALAKIYEDEAGFAAHAAIEPGGMAGSHETMSAPLGHCAEQAKTVSIDAERDRIWLEQRFAEIASRIERSLAEIRPECSFVEFGDRFERLEQRLDSALADIATRADLESLEAIEAQIGELTAQLDAAQAKFARLDTIETELRALAERVSDQRLAELFGKSAPAIPAMESVAQVVADRVSAQMPRLDELSAEERRRVDELRELVQGFISEQRLGDEQTTAVLDTMQQAMIRLLDRMDAIESSGPVATMQARTFGADASQPAHSAARGEQTMAPGFVHRGSHKDPDAQRADAARDQQYDPAIYQMYPEPSVGGQGGQFDVEARDAESAKLQPADAAPSPWKGEGEPQTAERGQQGREDLIAAARRARRHAAQAPADPGEEAAVETAEPAAAQSPGPDKARRFGAVQRSRSLSRLTIAMMMLFVVGATYTMATALRKPVIGEPIERKLLAPETEIRERAERSKTGRPDAERGDLGGEIDRTGEHMRGQGSGNDTAPAFQQRPGEPSRTMRAAAEAAIQPQQHDLRTAPGNVIEAPSPAQAPDSDRPQPTRNVPAAAVTVADPLPGIVLQEEGSVASLAELRQLQQLQHRASLSNRLGAAQLPAQALPAALIPDGPAAPADSIARDTGAASSARMPAEMPPAAVGPQSLRLAAAMGDPSAEFEVGARLAEGRSIQQDFKQAAAWYQRAATQGFAPAQYRLATLFERGLGVKTDLARARIWYLRAAEQGHVKAMHNLAVLSAGRDSNTPDYATAVHWFTAAAERGLADSQYNLGVLYDSGLGVKRDPKQSYRWFALGAQAGDQEATRRRDMLAAKLTAAELQEVDGDVRSWRTKPVDKLVNEAWAVGKAWQQRAPTGRVE